MPPPRSIPALMLAAILIAAPAGCRAHPRPAPEPPARMASPGVRGSGAGIEVWWWVVADRMVTEFPAGVPAAVDPPEAAAGKPGDGASPPDEADAKDGDRAPAEKPPEKHGQPPGPAPIVYTFDDGRSDLEDCLGPYLDRPVPLPQETLDRWHASGLRAIAVPREDLEGLEQRLRLTGPVNRQWLGQVTMWSDIAQGPWREGRSPVKVEDQDVQLAPGRLRLQHALLEHPPR